MQRILRRNGYRVGRIDGRLGSRTRHALRSISGEKSAAQRCRTGQRRAGRRRRGRHR
ncbi:MAG: peptidoglycan-binding domain-containing protein [Hyphomicrobiaceae bacterium]